MNALLSLISAVLFGAIVPVEVPDAYDSERLLALEAGEYVVVAMLPENVASHEERVSILSAASDDVATATGKSVVLTDDLLAFLSVKRILCRGVNDYERRALASRLSRANTGLYRSCVKNTA